MPIKWKSKILLAELDETYGTDPTPAGADNAILATNIVLSPMEGQDVSRDLELPWLAAQATIPAGLYMRIQYRVELVPSGAAGTPPAWAPLLLAMGTAETVSAATSVAYNPVSDVHPSVTHHFWVGATRFVLKGCRGTAVLRFTAQGIPYLECDFRGLFTAPSEQTRAVPDLSNFLKPDIVSKANTPTFTVDGVSLVMRSLAFDLGNDVQFRGLVGPAGAESILIVDRAESIAVQVEAVPLSTWNPFTKAATQASVAVGLVHGTAAGKIATLAVAGAQVMRPSEFRNEQGILEWGLRLTPLPTTGNDQWTLTLT